MLANQYAGKISGKKMEVTDVAETLLSVQNLTKKFEDHTILDGLNLEIKKGEVIVIVGPSGCG